jgi:hypothetical protein
VEDIDMIEDMYTSAIMTAEMRALRETLGLIEAEIFITTIKQERFDYTEWRRDNLFQDMTLEDLVKEAADFERRHPESIPKKARVV